jgi:hypothetical protein
MKYNREKLRKEIKKGRKRNEECRLQGVLTCTRQRGSRGDEICGLQNLQTNQHN